MLVCSQCSLSKGVGEVLSEHTGRSRWAGMATACNIVPTFQPTSAALKLVASLAAEASSGRLRGAALLDLLHSRCAGAMGDAAAHRLALRLLRAAAEPYFGMLERWL